jgi:hypothetical protein
MLRQTDHLRKPASNRSAESLAYAQRRRAAPPRSAAACRGVLARLLPADSAAAISYAHPRIAPLPLARFSSRWRGTNELLGRDPARVRSRHRFPGSASLKALVSAMNRTPQIGERGGGSADVPPRSKYRLEQRARSAPERAPLQCLLTVKVAISSLDVGNYRIEDRTELSFPRAAPPRSQSRCAARRAAAATRQAPARRSTVLACCPKRARPRSAAYP